MSARGDKLVNAALVPTGLDTHGILAPPPGVAGWYDERGWPKPGFPGASILAGHINTRRNGPDTFAHLPQVRAGAVVTVRYSSGDEVDFVVTRSAPVPKTQVPKDDSIWDAANRRPLLRLITCDPTTPVKGGHYVGNWVVWASPPQ
ncbi:MAG TPA: class F sortase [Ornithinibacter sp.]|jgi:sortase (surface protein transpeptidase)|nr:class F sortase [Ornithinibacter sp.]